MNRLFGNNVVKIEAPQDRSELKFVVLENDTDFDTINVRFYNSDNSPITIDFSHLSIAMLFDPERYSMSLGEFEYVKSIDNGFEVFGDFGIIWVYCDSSSPKL
ncbi:hypothetical protein L1286_00340 [Pseudoalteromonas sp. SMS1]|uniref:hypothetical protein n=1 Tax=Pseudoalteromonas sp. SMS1 TaxID=2908894 RepID=UPI001F2F0797|nr:hypothetical protein [Pseudoalteromonas sp. SMS1]MCF2855903.1 hypothetical protein [Pseudoalteromonas sp. SMS1]